MPEVSNESLVRVHYDGAILQIGESTDVPGYVNICAPGDNDREYWGKLDISMPHEVALKLSEAIMKVAIEFQTKRSVAEFQKNQGQ